MTRPHISAKTDVLLAIRQAPGGCILCGICRQPLWPTDDRIREHTPARALLVASGVANPDDPQYLSWVHKACAYKKTRGCTGTSKKGSVADGDTHKIAKADRMAHDRLEPKPRDDRRKIQSPGFPKHLTKTMGGMVVPRRQRGKR